MHQGAAAIVPVQSVRVGGRTQRFFMYQRQKYEIDESGTKVSELAMPDKEPLKHYQDHSGYQTSEAIFSKHSHIAQFAIGMCSG